MGYWGADWRVSQHRGQAQQKPTAWGGREHCRKMTCDLKCYSPKSSSLSSCRGCLVLFQRCRCTRAVGSWELQQVHPACLCFPATEPGSLHLQHQVMDGLTPPLWLQVLASGLRCHLLHRSWAVWSPGWPQRCRTHRSDATATRWAPAGLPQCSVWVTGVNEKNQKKSQRSAATDMKKWEAGSPCRSVSWEWRWAAHQQVRNARPREAAEEELSIRLRCLPAPTVTDEVSAKANKLHMKWWLAGLNAAHSCLRWNSSGLLCWQATADICEQVTQFSLPAACPGLSAGLFIKLPSPYQKEKVKKKRRKCFIRTISLLWDWGTLQLILFLKCNSFIRDL